VSIELSDAVRALAAVLVLCPLAYIATRAVWAARRGENAAQAALSAVRVVGPPALLAMVGLVGLTILAAFSVVALILAFGAAVGDDKQAGNLLLVFLAGIALFVLAIVGAVAWGLVRMVRATRKRAGS
jgi:hypothetical protein